MNSIILNFGDSVDVNKKIKQLKKQYPEARVAKANVDFEKLEDEYLLALAEERLKNDTGKRISQEEILAERGLTIADLDRMLEEEDIELEYELPIRIFT